jgi:ATP-binding cassette subfamily B protein
MYIGVFLRAVTNHILPPIVLKQIIDILSGTNADHFFLAPQLFYYIYILTGLIIVGYFIARINSWVIVYFQSRVMRELHNYAFEKLTKHSYKFFTNQFTGGLVSKAKRLVRGFENMHDIFLWDFYMTLVMLVGMFYIMYKNVPQIANGFMLWSVFYIVVSAFFIKYKIKYDLREAEADSKVGGGLADTISNIFTVKIFSGRSREITRYQELTKDEQIQRSKAWQLGNISDGVQGALMVGLNTIILVKLANGWVEGTVTTGVFVLIQTYMMSLFDKLWNLSKAMTKFVKSLTEVKEITDIFEKEIDIQDPKNPEALKIKSGNIAFNNMSFEYIEDHEVFTNFNLDIKSGEKIGLVGHSGSGKSTITKLLLRFADVQEGMITIDGQNIRNITQDDLRNCISYVPQESILFHRTIKENIAYSEPGATDEEIIAAAKKAHAHEFISGLQHGYDTLVGERGVKLSGGERQRVAIARAMLKQAPILILDEATSSLDSVSESYIQEAFGELMKDKTTIVIAHRLSTVQKMDRIIVLDKGKIVEEGTHKELLKKDGVYADLWNHQTGGFIE